MLDQVRQGDIYFVKVPTPQGIMSALSDNPSILQQGWSQDHSGIIAHGEITGHKHKILDSVGKLFKAPKAMSENHNIIGYVQTPVEQITEVVHDEHAPVKLDKNSTYEVRQQREHVPSDNLSRYVEPPRTQRVAD